MAGLISIAVLVGWIVAAIWFAKRASKDIKNPVGRLALTLFLIAAIVTLPVADEIIGGFQFRALCAEKAVLKIDAQKIRGRIVRMTSNPSNKDVENTAIRIYYTHVIFQDIATKEELASNGYVVAKGGILVKTLAGGNEMTPLTIFPSTCSGPGNLPTSKKYEFKIDTKTGGTIQ
jgi:hypothetical protein